MLRWIARRTQVEVLAERLTAALDRIAAQAAQVAALSDRVSALEERLDGLRQELGDRVAGQEDRVHEMEDRLTRIEDRTRRVDDERSGTADYLDRMIVRYDAHLVEQGEAHETLRLAITRLERRLDLHAEGAERTDAALLDRIERLRSAPPAR